MRWILALAGLLGTGGWSMTLTAQAPPPAAATNPAPPAIQPRVIYANPNVSRPAPLSPQPPGGMPEPLAWDGTSKEINPAPGDMDGHVSFSVTNVSPAEVVIKAVRPSCGCTVVKLPATPWALAPNASGTLEAVIDLRGKRGTLNKYLMVETTAGMKMLTLRVNIPEAPADANASQRTRNLMAALADRQAVFKGSCAECHVKPTLGKKDQALFEAACGICHEAEHRASMVPDLAMVQAQRDREYWRAGISKGRPGTLMPAFAYGEGGILSAPQIESLVAYLTSDYLNQRRVILQPAPMQTPSVLGPLSDPNGVPSRIPAVRSANEDLPPLPPQ